MKLWFLSTTLVCSLAQAGDLGYRFNIHTSRCELSGAPGRNPDWAGECGDQREARLDGADLSLVNLVGITLDGAEASQVDFTRSDLRHASLRGAVLVKADFSGCDLRGADFTGANVSGAKWQGAVIDDSTVLPFPKSKTVGKGFKINAAGTR